MAYPILQEGAILAKFLFRFGRRFRTGPYETAEMSIEEEFDDEKIDYLSAHEGMKNLIDALVDADREDYAKDNAKNPRPKR